MGLNELVQRRDSGLKEADYVMLYIMRSDNADGKMRQLKRRLNLLLNEVADLDLRIAAELRHSMKHGATVLI